MIRRMRPFASPTRSWNHRTSALPGLVAQPQPGELDCGASCARVARLGDTLVAPDPTALPGTWGETEVAAHLAPVAEVAEEHFVSKHGSKGTSDATQARKPCGGAVLCLGDRLLF